MGETTNQIADYIEAKRDDLGSNLQELEQKVKSVTDWRQQFEKNPMTLIAIAFGGGLLLASVLGSRHTGSVRSNSSGESRTPHNGTDFQASKALETWDSIKGALIGVAATRFKEYVEEIIPGFHDQFEKSQAVKTLKV